MYLYEKRRSSVAPLQGRFNRTLHLTYTLISINALFFCLVSPLAILSVLVKGKEDIREYKFMFNVVYLLAYANHSFNFIFYGLSSPPYRECILDLCTQIKTGSSKSTRHTQSFRQLQQQQQQQQEVLANRRASAAPALVNCHSTTTNSNSKPVRSILRNGTIH